MKHLIQKIRQPKVFQTLISLLLVILLVGASVYYLKIQNRMFLENSVVNTPVTTLSPTVIGKLKQILVTEGQSISKGDAVAIVGSEVIHAYADGVVTMTDKQIGSIVTPQTPVVQTVNLNEMRIDGTIDENKGLSQVKIGQVVSFTIDAYPGQTFWGYVDEIGQTAKVSSLSFSISSERPVQQFEIFAHFDAQHNPQIKNGMSAKMTIFTSSPGL